MFNAPTAFDGNGNNNNNLTVGEGQIPVTVVIKLDEYPSKIRWQINKLGLDVKDVGQIRNSSRYKKLNL